MSKRGSKSGDSPTPKNQKLRATLEFLSCSTSDSEELTCSPSFLDTSAGSQPPAPAGSSPPDFGFLADPPDELGTQNSTDSGPTVFTQLIDDQENAFTFEAPKDIQLRDVLEDNIEAKGLEESAKIILAHDDLKAEILRILFKDSHENLKYSLRQSQLCADKNDREYLLSLTPRNLCEEFKTNSPRAFLLLVQGLLGISNPEDIFESQFLLNNVCFMYSTVSKIINRKATGYALLMTTAVRDGGLREDTIKLFSMLVHPRTSQKYDKDVLAKGWDQPLKTKLQSEREHFRKLHNALEKKADLLNDATIPSVELADVGEKVSCLLE